MSDFRRYHGVWLWDALDEVPPRILLALAEDLQFEPHSAFAASLQGGPQYRGWGVDRHMAANLWDLTAAVNTAPKKKAPQHPRPTKRKATGPTMRELVRAATQQNRG